MVDIIGVCEHKSCSFPMMTRIRLMKNYPSWIFPSNRSCNTDERDTVVSTTTVIAANAINAANVRKQNAVRQKSALHSYFVVIIPLSVRYCNRSMQIFRLVSTKLSQKPFIGEDRVAENVEFARKSKDIRILDGVGRHGFHVSFIERVISDIRIGDVG